MRLLERDKRTVHLRARRADADNPYGEPLPAWGEAVALRCAVQPLSGGLEAAVYGEHVKDMRAMLYTGIAEIREGDGVCVDAPPEAAPDYRVIAVQAWRGHRRIHIERTALEEAGT